MEWLPWQDATATAAGLAVVTLLLRTRTSRWARRAIAWTRELAAMFGLYALWQLAGDLSIAQASGAFSRGRDIARFEHWAHMPAEATVQRLVLPDRGLIRLLDYYYAGVHVIALGVCLIWLFVRHRDRYPAVRNVLVFITGASLLIQLIPVAPPRLVPGLGLVDTGHVIGPSVYPATVAPGLDQLSAMPSLHVGWALVVASAVVYSLRSPWRWLIVLYPACTWWVVIVTGNHYWMDGAVELALFVLGILLVRLLNPPAPLRPPCRAEEMTMPGGQRGHQRRHASDVSSSRGMAGICRPDDCASVATSGSMTASAKPKPPD